MDILISSNLERLLYELYDHDADEVAKLMNSLNTTGEYTVSDEVKAKISAEFYGGFCDEQGTADTISELFEKYHYLCDTHSAVAVKVYNDYVAATGDNTPAVIASTASPYKFSHSVLPCVCDGELPVDEFETVAKLNEVTGAKIPRSLEELKSKPVLHKTSVDKSEMSGFIKDFLG